MKRFIFILMLLLITTPAVALNKGSVNITVVINKGPNIQSVQPSDGYTITVGDTLETSVTADDPNNDILKYRFLINNVVKRAWSTESTFSYVLQESDAGLNKIKAEVTDGMITVPTEEVEIYVFRKAPGLPH